MTGGILMNKRDVDIVFAFEHLPDNLKEVSKPFNELAQQLLLLPENPERDVALRKLLESKDSAVRTLVLNHGGLLKR